jgi:hypothetical protein
VFGFESEEARRRRRFRFSLAIECCSIPRFLFARQRRISEAGSEPEINEFFSAVHRKLGNAKNANEQSFFVNFGTAGTMVTLRHQTDFDVGSANEEFVRGVGEEPLLVNYRIESRALITK